MVVQRNIFRQSDFIETAIDNLTRALRDGGILVVMIVFLFLANFRAASITLVAMPLSLLAAVLAMKLTGATINSMTLGGMAIAVGAIVDDAIIDVENVFRRLRENATETRGRAALGSRGRLPRQQRDPRVDRVRDPRHRTGLHAAVLPHGVEGRLLRPLGFAYLVALFASLFVALTVTPVLCALLLPKSKAVRSGHEPRWITWLKGVYERQLEWCLPRGTFDPRGWPGCCCWRRSRRSAGWGGRSCPSSTRGR